MRPASNLTNHTPRPYREGCGPVAEAGRSAIQNERALTPNADRLIGAFLSGLNEDYAKTLADGKKRTFKKFRAGSGYRNLDQAIEKATALAAGADTSCWVYPVMYRGLLITPVSPPLTSLHYSQAYVVDPDGSVWHVGNDRVEKIR